jgi:hypothetical protein
LVPVFFRGGAHIYYSQPPAKIVIQGQHAIVGTPTAALVAANDLYEEIEFEFSRSAATGKQKLKFYIAGLQKTRQNNVDYYTFNSAVMCSQIDGSSELLIGDYQVNSITIPADTPQWTIGLLLCVNQLTGGSGQPVNPKCNVYVAAKYGQNFTILGVPNISGSFFNPNTTLEFLNDAERNFALGAAGIVEPARRQGQARRTRDLRDKAAAESARLQRGRHRRLRRRHRSGSHGRAAQNGVQAYRGDRGEVCEDGDEVMEEITMRELSTIQKREKLNRVFAADEPGAGSANHEYDIYPAEGFNEDTEPLVVIQFQHGPRKLPDSVHGVLDTDLLEIVRDRLKGFQSGEFSTRENACALTHIEEALMWMNKRVEDRIERGVLGTDMK